jgi:hypothetical protein
MDSSRQKTPVKEKISAMILKVADGLFDTGETLEKRRNLLQVACSAWNIGCLVSPQRYEYLEKYIDKFREVNNPPEDVCRDLREDMLQLIEQKDKLYPKIMVQIIHSDISVEDGKENLVVLSTPFLDKSEQQTAQDAHASVH